MSKPYRILVFSGKMGTGKDYLASRVLEYTHKSMILALADFFKIEVCIKEGMEFSKVFGQKDEETRRLLQLYGTEKGRDVYGKDIWLKALEVTMDLHHRRSGIQQFIITDCRFQNEVEKLKEWGAKIIRINAPKRNARRLHEESGGNSGFYSMIKNHVSETELDDYKFEYRYYNDHDTITNDFWKLVG